MAGLGMRRIAERQRIEAGDRPRAHGEHVAQNAADAGRGTLIGLDVARVVVALHLEHHRKPVADVDHAGVLARSLDHPGRLGRQRAQVHLRGLVRAMLVPHRRENAELGEGRRPSDQIEDALVFVGLEAVLGNQCGSDGGFIADHARYLTRADSNFIRRTQAIHAYSSTSSRLFRRAWLVRPWRHTPFIPAQAGIQGSLFGLFSLSPLGAR